MALKLAELQGSSAKAMLQAASTDTRANVRTRKTARILVVDDEAHVRSMIAATLERQGYEVMLASSGREAIDALEIDSFELILTDIVMQEGNGLALLERIHASESQSSGHHGDRHSRHQRGHRFHAPRRL